MDDRALRHFLNLADSRHFGRASEASHISPSALSRSIARLEQEAGAPLFERKPQCLADARRRSLFLDYARSALGEWDAMRSALM